MNNHPNALPAGYRLNEYEIKGVLGSGGFGVTYKAYDHDLDKTVAIKEYLPPDFAVRVGRTTVGPKSEASKDDYDWGLARVLDEARTLARFDHPHINKVHRFIKANGTAYLVLEYIEGDMLSDLLRDKGRFSEAAIRRMLDELLDGLAAVHKAGYVHRDIKPANIIFRRDGSAVLLDFGAARQVRGKTVTKVLTAGYAPVEQHLNNPVGARSDIYSLGICAYRCLIGGDESVLVDAPNRALLIQQGQADKDMPSAVVVGKGKYSDSLLKAIDWAMQVDEGDRPQSVGELQAVLSGEGEVEGVATSPVVKEAKNDSDKSAPVETSAQTNEAEPPVSWEFVGKVSAVAVVLVVLLGVGLSVSQQQEETEHAEFRQLFGRDASVQQVDDKGGTDLHIAAKNGWAKLARWLIDNGADVNAETDKGVTPLYVAGFYNTVTVAKLLIANGAYVSAKADDGYTPLHAAAHNNSVGTAHLLLANGAGVDAKNNFSATPLYYAARQNSVDVAKVLLANGASVNAEDGVFGPLHEAARRNGVDVARVLLTNGADVNAEDFLESTPLDWAILNDHDALQSLLRRYGGQCNTQCQ